MIFLPYNISIVALLLALLPALYDQSIHLEELADDSLPLKKTSQRTSMYQPPIGALQLSRVFLVLRLALPFDSSPSFEVVRTFNICSSFWPFCKSSCTLLSSAIPLLSRKASRVLRLAYSRKL
jgi:hypothetical protein